MRAKLIFDNNCMQLTFDETRFVENIWKGRRTKRWKNMLEEEMEIYAARSLWLIFDLTIMYIPARISASLIQEGMNAHLVEFLDVKARRQCFLMVSGTSHHEGVEGTTALLRAAVRSDGAGTRPNGEHDNMLPKNVQMKRYPRSLPGDIFARQQNVYRVSMSTDIIAVLNGYHYIQ
ncbi:hypothetical protein CBL_00525 [Carabus blaptoides fortunei]